MHKQKVIATKGQGEIKKKKGGRRERSRITVMVTFLQNSYDIFTRKWEKYIIGLCLRGTVNFETKLGPKTAHKLR